jgi:rfaE bifunctional protein kinase chain/domain
MNYKQIISDFKKKKILIIGDLILDHYVWGTVDRISPEAPIPVVKVTKDDYYKLGGAGNVASNIVALGAKSSVLGVIGNDARGKILKSRLKEEKINTAGVFRTDRRTTVKTRVIAHKQQVVRVDREDNSPLDDLCTDKIKTYLESNIKNFDAIIISDYKKGVITKKLIRDINNLAKRNKTIVAVDPKVGHVDYYHKVTLITPNKKEAASMSHIDINDEKTLNRAGNYLLKKLDCKAVLVTRGDEGMTLFEKDRKAQNIETVARDAYDVTGAGDTVISVFTLSHISGAPLYEAAKIANHAAGIVVGVVGTATATPEKILRSLNRPS